MEKELDRIKAAGLKGVKLHPDFQHFCLDDEKAIAMFEAMAARNLPALIHTGDSRYPYSEPARMARVLEKVPKLRVICAHLGGWSVWTDAWHTLAGREGVWVDTSSSLYASPTTSGIPLHFIAKNQPVRMAVASQFSWPYLPFTPHPQVLETAVPNKEPALFFFFFCL